MHKLTCTLHRFALLRPRLLVHPTTITTTTTTTATRLPLRPTPLSCLSTRWSSTIPPPTQQQNEENQDELETIDPKDYPELYPELQSEQVQEEEELVDTEWFVEDEQQHDQNFVPLWQRRAVGDHLHGRWAMQEASKRLIDSGDMTPENIQALLEENKMDAVQVLDVRGRCDWTEYMIVAESDKGDRFLCNVAEQIRQTVNKAIRENPSVQDELTAPHIEGRDDQSGWVLIDLGSCVVHLFTPEVRKHYDLEGLWIPNDSDKKIQE
ncbi:Oligomerization domain-containing protein [Zychaea mexicana]|uniref:Oligomerization domain-containing protein n=1 Tax=Zychaea mexicana TaxID=64656 RepID=UPI0022FE64BA|nr:Oligomerization domain-containing protein [Zychaea mexicana]KAI9474325.1 Oligomerization domain-containing protein [Zychaea mexicana]